MNVYYFHHQADELLGTASEQFLGKSVKEIKQTILQTLEGHLRAILGKLPCPIGTFVHSSSAATSVERPPRKLSILPNPQTIFFFKLNGIVLLCLSVMK